MLSHLGRLRVACTGARHTFIVVLIIPESVFDPFVQRQVPSLSNPPRWRTVLVADASHGVPPRKLDRIFRALRRARPSRLRQQLEERIAALDVTFGAGTATQSKVWKRESEGRDGGGEGRCTEQHQAPRCITPPPHAAGESARSAGTRYRRIAAARNRRWIIDFFFI